MVSALMASEQFSTQIIADSSVNLISQQGTYDGGKFYTLVNAVSGYKLLAASTTSVQSSDVPGIPGQIFSFAIAGTNLWVMSKEVTLPAVNIRHYHVTVPLPAVAVETNAYGDSDSVPCQLAITPSGGLFAYWFQNTTVPVEAPAGTWPLVVGIAHRTSNGVWSDSSHSIVSDGGALASCGTTIAVLPNSNEAWAFLHRDSYHSIELIRMAEVGNLYIVTIVSSYISQAVDGENGPEGENPYLVAIADSLNGTIHLTYQRNNFIVWSVSPFLKGAYMAAAMIKPDASKTFSQFNNYVERIEPYGTWVNGPGQSILYRKISAAGRTTSAYWSTQSGEAWSTPVFVDEVMGKLENSRDVPRIVYKNALNANKILMFPWLPVNLKLQTITEIATNPAGLWFLLTNVIVELPSSATNQFFRSKVQWVPPLEFPKTTPTPPLPPRNP